jgi:regulatory Fis family protein
LLKTLNRFGGNRTRASIALGISIRGTPDKLHNFTAQGIDIPEGHSGPFYGSK